MLDSIDVEIQGSKFTVKELTVQQMMPLLPRMNNVENHEELQKAQLDMMKMCVYEDGQLVGEGVNEIGLKAYLKLVEAAVEVNGLGAGKG